MYSPKAITLKPLLISVMAFMLWGSSCAEKEAINPIVMVIILCCE